MQIIHLINVFNSVRALCFLLGILSTAISWGQRYYVDSYQLESELEGKVNDIATDSLGFLWVATDQGIYRLDYGEVTRVRAGKYTVLLYKGKNELLVGSAGKVELLHTRLQQPEFSEFLNFEDKDYHTYPHHITKCADGDFWLIIPDGIIRFNEKRSKKYQIENLKGTYADLRISTGADGGVWVSSEQADLFRFDRPADRFSEPQGELNIKHIHAMALFQKNTMLMQTEKGLYFMEMDSTGQMVKKTLLKHAPQDISLIKVTSDGDILLGTSHTGMYFGGYRNKRFSFNKIFNGNDPHRVMDLSFKEANSIHIDTPKIIWVAHEKGVTLLRELTFTNASNVLPHGNISGIAHLANGETYVTIEGIIYKITGEEPPYIIEDVHFDLGVDRPTSLAAVGDRLWICTNTNKIAYVENGVRSKLTDMSYRGEDLFSVRMDDDENAWVAQAPSDEPIKGILKVTSEMEVVEYGEEAGFESRMLATDQASYGTIYCAGIGETSYLYRYDSAADRFENISAPLKFDYGDNFEVHDIAIAADSTIWMGSTAGLLWYKNGEVKKLPVNEFEENEAVAVRVSNDGVIWFSTDSKGIVRYKDGEYVVYNQKMGLPGNYMIYRTLSIDKNNRIWAGTREGLTVSVGTTPQPEQVPKPMWLDIKMNGRKVDPDLGRNFKSGSVMEASFVALAYPLESVSYQYRILGREDTTWRPRFFDNNLVLKNLETGDYTLQVKAHQSAEYLESEPLEYRFTIDKIWYATWWGITALVFIGVCLAVIVFYTGYTVRMRAIRKQQDALKKLVDERTRELQSSNKKLEQQKVALRQSAESLQQKNKELDQFAYIVSHDLKAPLRGINHLSMWIEEDLGDRTDGDVRKNMDLLRSRVHRMENLIDGILAYARVGKIEVTHEEVDLDALVQEVIQLLEIPEQFTVSINKKLPTVCANSTLMEQIFSNLISNAMKYHDKSEGTITIDYEDDDGNHIFSVIDDGPGIPKEFHEKAFAIFQTLQSKDTKESTGVGLAIVKKIISEHDGDIWIESERGQGTTFKFTLPKGPLKPE